jgi:hypothetical protein
MTDKKVYENTKPYYELFYAHKMQSRVLYETHDRFDITYSELITEGVKTQKRFEDPTEDRVSAYEDMAEIQAEMRRFHKSLFWEQHAKGVAILPSVNYVDQPF